MKFETTYNACYGQIYNPSNKKVAQFSGDYTFTITETGKWGFYNYSNRESSKSYLTIVSVTTPDGVECKIN